MLGLFLLAQSVGPSGPILDLPALLPKSNCLPSTDEEEVVICAKEQDSPYRLTPLPPQFERPSVPKAETGVLGGRATIEGEQADIGGAPSNRAMARMKWRF